jgi:hypothetical protein
LLTHEHERPCLNLSSYEIGIEDENASTGCNCTATLVRWFPWLEFVIGQQHECSLQPMLYSDFEIGKWKRYIPITLNAMLHLSACRILNWPFIYKQARGACTDSHFCCFRYNHGLLPGRQSLRFCLSNIQ